MDAVVLGLQGALVGVAKEYVGRPEVSSLRGARPELLVNFPVALATGPGLPPAVALRLNHKSGLQNNLVIAPEAAEKLGKGLIDVERLDLNNPENWALRAPRGACKIAAKCQ